MAKTADRRLPAPLPTPGRLIEGDLPRSSKICLGWRSDHAGLCIDVNWGRGAVTLASSLRVPIGWLPSTRHALHADPRDDFLVLMWRSVSLDLWRHDPRSHYRVRMVLTSACSAATPC